MLAAAVHTLISARSRTLLRLVQAILLSFCATAATAQESLIGSDLPGASADYSPSGFFTGPIEIPDVVRFRTLPHRMDYEPFITDVQRVFILSDRYVPLSIRMLQEATDEEIIEVAALQLYRIARENMADTSSAAESLLNRFKNSTSRRVRSACMLALAAGGAKAMAADITEYTSTASDSERLVLEPVLASWGFQPAGEIWRSADITNRVHNRCQSCL